MARLLVLDTETGGDDPLHHSLLSIGAIVWDSGQCGATLDLQVAEFPMHLTERALEINGINPDNHARTGLTVDNAAKQLVDFLEANFGRDLETNEKVVLCGHNIAFDIGFLKRLCRLSKRDYASMFSHRSLDTASTIRFLTLVGLIPAGIVSSDDAFNWFDVTPADADRHTALGDARATALLLTRLVDWCKTLRSPSAN